MKCYNIQFLAIFLFYRGCPFKGNSIRPLWIIFARSRIHPMFCRSSHDYQPQISQLFIGWSRKRYSTLISLTHIAINRFTTLGHTDKSISPTGFLSMQHIVTSRIQIAFQSNFHCFARLWNCQRNTVIPIVFRTIFGSYSIPASLFLYQLHVFLLAYGRVSSHTRSKSQLIKWRQASNISSQNCS